MVNTKAPAFFCCQTHNQRRALSTPNEPHRQLEGLSDFELLERESNDRSEFMQLERDEPQSSGTTFREIRASHALLNAWQRWTQSGMAARLRGLLPRRPQHG